MTDAAGIAETLLLAMDGDFLPGAGMGCDNEGRDVPLNKATPKEMAWWAARTLTATDDDPDRIARAYLQALRRTGPSPKLLAVIDAQLRELNRANAQCAETDHDMEHLSSFGDDYYKCRVCGATRDPDGHGLVRDWIAR